MNRRARTRGDDHREPEERRARRPRAGRSTSVRVDARNVYGFDRVTSMAYGEQAPAVGGRPSDRLIGSLAWPALGRRRRASPGRRRSAPARSSRARPVSGRRPEPDRRRSPGRAVGDEPAWPVAREQATTPGSTTFVRRRRPGAVRPSGIGAARSTYRATVDVGADLEVHLLLLVEVVVEAVDDEHGRRAQGQRDDRDERRA